MFNFLATSFLTTCVTLACVCPAQTCGGACGCAMSHAIAPTTAPAAPTDPHAGMQMSQTPGTRTYQSFSYEPGVGPQLPPVAAPRYSAMPATRSLRQKSENAAATGKFR